MAARRRGLDWSRPEVEATVAAYFELLEAELAGTPLVKRHRNQVLGRQLPRRSRGAIEYKHGNISAILCERGVRPVAGYQPHGNYQALLAEVVDEWLARNDGFSERLRRAADAPPRYAELVTEGDAYFEAAPDAREPSRRAGEFDWRTTTPTRIDYVAREAANRALGEAGERFVATVERARLASVGASDWASRVEIVSQTTGDGLGFDVRSFDVSGPEVRDRLIEVKTTRGGKYTPFLVTARELRCSQAHAPEYHLYRLYNFGDAARPAIYVRSGYLMECLRLDPATYRAAV